MPADASERAAATTDETSSRKHSRMVAALFDPVDIASLVFVRIAFGGILLWHLLELFQSGAIDALYSPSQFHFKYLGFDWVRPWPGIGLQLHFATLCVLASGVMCGLCYRWSAGLFCLGFTYVLLLDRALYHNHYYLVVLISGILAVVPAHRSFSLDVLRRPELRARLTPAWTVWLLRFQVGIVYLYSGLAKLEFDWLIHLQPVRLILARETDFPLLGPFLREEWAVSLFAYGGLAFDLLVVPLLLWRRTRLFAFVVAVGFHVLNALLFDIGLFPWLMIAMTSVFFDPHWPRLCLKRLRWAGLDRRNGPDALRAGPSASLLTLPPASRSPASRPRTSRQMLTLLLLIVYAAVQLLVPLRHHLYPGHPSWTEEGHDFSWRLMHRFKASRDAVFVVTSPSAGRNWHLVPEAELTEKQLVRMSGHPDLILEFSHFLADEMQAAGYHDVQIRVLTSVSLNGREPQMLVDPRIDLAAEPRSWRRKPWILPLNQL